MRVSCIRFFDAVPGVLKVAHMACVQVTHQDFLCMHYLTHLEFLRWLKRRVCKSHIRSSLSISLFGLQRFLTSLKTIGLDEMIGIVYGIQLPQNGRKGEIRLGLRTHQVQKSNPHISSLMRQT